jgi:hypothetical protein
MTVKITINCKMISWVPQIYHFISCAIVHSAIMPIAILPNVIILIVVALLLA